MGDVKVIPGEKGVAAERLSTATSGQSAPLAGASPTSLAGGCSNGADDREVAPMFRLRGFFDDSFAEGCLLSRMEQKKLLEARTQEGLPIFRSENLIPKGDFPLLTSKTNVCFENSTVQRSRNVMGCLTYVIKNKMSLMNIAGQVRLVNLVRLQTDTVTSVFLRQQTDK
jgi:hypothetical protein